MLTAAQTAKTEYILAANGTRFAYRRLGRSQGVPLVLHIHFHANMDFWDPRFLKSLAIARPVIIFDNAGVGRSTGEVPTTFQGRAEQVIAFTTALGIPRIDLLGFSMGGVAVQQVTLTAPELVRKLIIAGSGASEPSSSSDISGLVWPRENAPPEPISALATAVTPEEVESALTFSFFYDDDYGRAAAKAYWNRLHERTAEPLHIDFLDIDIGTARQLAAFRDWTTVNARNSFDRLHQLKMPVLVANGDNDVLIPTSRSWELVKRIPNSQLIIYPRAGHGFIWQYGELFAKNLNEFLDGDEFEVN